MVSPITHHTIVTLRREECYVRAAGWLTSDYCHLYGA